MPQHVRIEPADAEVKAAACAPGTPEHFRRYCRGQEMREVAVFCAGGIRGFRVPVDGAWMINGMYREAGTEIDLVEGDKVTYYQVAPDPSRPRRTARWARPAVGEVQIDPATMRPIGPAVRAW